MNVSDLEREIGQLDATYRPVATAQIGLEDVDRLDEVGPRIEAALAGLGVRDRTQRVLWSAIALYESGDEALRAELRELFRRHQSFTWAARLPPEWDSAADFRANLVHLSLRDHGPDTRDEILTLQCLCSRARECGIDVDPILTEVAAMSSDVDRYGMGSMRDILRRYGSAREQ